MTQVTLQFHAAPDELVGLAIEWAERHGLAVVFERFFPIWRAEPFSGTVVEEAVERIDRVALCRSTPDLDADRASAFLIRNPETLWVSVGTLDAGLLRESAIGADSDDPATIRLWRSIVRNAKGRMHVGATVRSPLGQAERPYHRHATGAHELATRGVRVLAVGGWVEYLFSDVPPRPETQALFTGAD